MRKQPDLLTLVLARKRILEQQMASVERELENPDKDLSPKDKTELHKHEVTWHVRKLPEGYRASAEARERCLKETGIVLAETGETYVQQHTRGTLQSEVKGHKVSYAAGRMAAKLGRRGS